MKNALCALLASLALFACTEKPRKFEPQATNAACRDAYPDTTDECGGATDCTLRKIGNTIYFGLDSTVLDYDGQRTLLRQAEWLAIDEEVRVVVEGHADERGTREYNLALGERRAEAVRDYLVASGVDKARIEIVSYGKERPLLQGEGENIWAQNRRAAIVLQDLSTPAGADTEDNDGDTEAAPVEGVTGGGQDNP